MRTRCANARSLALASRTSSRSVASPTTGYSASRTRSSGCSIAASARRNRMPCLPLTRLRSPISSAATRFSALEPILCTRSTSSSTSASVISAVRVEHSAASSVRRTSGGEARRSDGYSLAARARHDATSFSDASANRSGLNPIALTRSSLSISRSSVFSPSRPGSDFSSTRNPAPPAAGMSGSSPAIELLELLDATRWTVARACGS